MKIVSLVIFILITTGCASSDMVRMGDSYTILKEGGTPALGQEFRLSRLKAKALVEAQSKCSEYNSNVMILKEAETEMSIGVFARYELKFKCE